MSKKRDPSSLMQSNLLEIWNRKYEISEEKNIQKMQNIPSFFIMRWIAKGFLQRKLFQF